MGGRIDLYGMPVTKRWTRLGAAAAAGATTITLAETAPGWMPGQQVRDVHIAAYFGRCVLPVIGG